MSLINDALKRARQAPPRNLPSTLPSPLQPASTETSPVLLWLIPAVVIILVVAAIFFIGWAVAHHTVRNIVAAPDTSVTQTDAVAVVPVVTPYAPPTPPPPPPAVLPQLQGIFYSPTRPTAILGGRTVGLGDHFDQYRVKAITKYTVTLVDAAGKDIQIGMGN